jgi:PAS domain S-box-containing protein
MPHRTAASLLRNITLFTGVEVKRLAELQTEIQQTIYDQLPLAYPGPVRFRVGESWFIGSSVSDDLQSTLIAGPYQTTDGTRSQIEESVPILSREIEEKLFEAVGNAATGVKRIDQETRERLEISGQFELMSRAIIAITGELSLENVLNRIVELARSVSGAKYAALGVPGPDGELEAFITKGIGAAEHAAIGDLPRGRGVLGELIRQRRSMRLRDISEHPASVGFPPNHPPMRSFLGVPISARGRVLGNLYLTEKRFAEQFTDEDERLVELLARHAAVAIENAQLYARLEFQQERLRFIIDQLPEAVILVETGPERVTMANRQASLLLGWDLTEPMPLEEFLTRNPRLSADGSRIPVDEIPIVRSLRYGETVTRSEIDLIRDDGERLTLLVNTAPLRQADGAIIAAALVFQDITMLKDAEQLKDDFLSLVSHELRTPLTTIHGGSHLLMDTWNGLDEETRLEILNDIFSESKRLANLVENMVQLANIRAGRFKVSDEPVNVRLLIERTLKGIDVSSLDRNVRVVSGSREVLAAGDVDSLDQVLRNLVQNAIKYVPDESPIDITVEQQETMITVGVRDYGQGVDPQDLPLLFDRFQRGKQRETTAGMGLGLYLSRMIVEAHGGQLWLENPEDGGSKFCFSVPVAEEE